MVNKNKRTKFISVLAVVMALCLSFCLGINTVSAETAQSVYDENKTLVQAIDKDGYFLELNNLATNDDAYLKQMQSVVNVAKAYNEFKNLFTADAYEQEDYDKIVKVINQTNLYVSLTKDNYLNYSASEAKYLKRIADEKEYINSNFKVRTEKLEEYKAAALKAMTDKKQALLKNQSGTANQTVGCYDGAGAQELESIYNKYVAELDKVTLDGADMDGTKKSIDDVKEKAIAEMQAVRHNDVERAYDKLQDYYAVKSGSMDGDAEALKKETAEAIKKCDDFWNGASNDILKEYSSEKKAFEDFFDENKIDDSAFKNKSVLQTKNGEVKVEAFTVDSSVKAPAEVFPTDAKLEVYNIVDTSPKRYNAQREILKNNKQISIAYFVDVLVYYDSELWTTVTEFEGKQVVYVVTINLETYYNNYIMNQESYFASVLRQIGIKSSAYQNKTEVIKSAAEEYKNDLCYIYYKDGEDGAVKSLDCSLSGGMLMFETNMLGSVAINGNENASLATNPIFWVVLILVLALIIVAVILVFKFIKYTIGFYLSDGSLIASVKARKGESFVMPEAPKKNGLVFAGWFEDAELKNRFLQTQVEKRKNISVYAKYVKELDATQLTDYFNNICVKLASNSILDINFETEAEQLTIAKVNKTEDAIKLYLDINTESFDSKPYGVKLVKAEDMFENPVLKVIDTTDAYKQALELIDVLIERFGLTESDPDVEAFSGKDSYVLTAIKPEKPAATEEELISYLQQLRKEALSYALTAENEKAEDGKMLVKAFKGEDGIYLYFALDAEACGLEKAPEEMGEDTPAMFVVTNDEEFEAAKELINKLMVEYGLEKVIDPSVLGEGSSKGFGYRIKYNG